MAERRRNRRRNRGNQTPGFIRSEQQAATKQDEVRLWMQRIQNARKLREDWEDKYRIEDLGKLFNSQVQHVMEGADDSIFINRFFPTLKAMLPGFINSNPRFIASSMAKSRNPLNRDQKNLSQGLLQAVAEQDNHFKTSLKLGLQQAFFRVGVVKVMFDPETERNPQAGELVYAMHPSGQPMVNELTGQPIPIIDPDTNEPVTEPSEIIKDEVYEWRWIDAANMLFPDMGPDQRQWPWVMEEITVPLKEAQDDERFPKPLRDQLRAAKTRTSRDEEIPPEWTDNLDPEVTYVEIWDVKAKRRLIYAEGQSFSSHSFLLDEDLPEGTESHPYGILSFNPITDPKPQPWPKPVTADWRNLQEIYNTRRRQMINAANRTARKIGYDQNTFADHDEATAALRSNVDMEAVELNDTLKPWVVIPDPSSPPDITREMAYERQDWIDVVGQTGARLGSPDSDTATEAIFSERANNLRDVEMRDRVQDWMGELGQKMLQKMQATMTIGLMVRIKGIDDSDVQKYLAQVYGPRMAQMAGMLPGLKERIIERFGNEKFMRVTREDLQFEANIKVMSGSAKARMLDIERQQFLAFIRILATAPQLMMSRELMHMVGELFDMVDDALIDELFQVGRMMMQAEMQRKSGIGGTNGAATSGQLDMGNVAGGGLRGMMVGGMG